MPPRLSRLCVLLLSLLVLGLPSAVLAQLGLQVSLTTSGYRFANGDVTTYNSTAAGKAPAVRTITAPTGFTAAVVISNFTAADVPVTFPSPQAAARRWTFRIYNSAGASVWVSDDDSDVTMLATPASLKARSSWRRLVRVPLQVNGAALPAGRYTLEASLAGDPSLGATAAFEVTDVHLAGDTGLKGQVFQYQVQTSFPINDGQQSAFSFDLAFPLPQPVKATVTVTEVRLDNARYSRPAFTWTGSTDDQGKYQVSTPPGQYRVTAVRFPGTTSNLPQQTLATLPTVARTGTAALTLVPGNLPRLSGVVSAGQFLTYNVYLPATIGDQPVILPPDTGVTGTVTESSVDGSTSPAPLVGVTVRLQPSLKSWVVFASAASAQRFSPTTTTDEQGAFTLHAFAGTYRLTVYRDATPGVYDSVTSIPLGFREVTITNGKITTVSVGVPAPVASTAVPVATVTSLEFSMAITATIGATPMSFVSAKGNVPTTGWTAPALRPRPSADPAVLEFDFVAVPPGEGEITGQVFAPITAYVQIPNSNVKTVRVYSASNSQELTSDGSGILHRVP